MSNFKSTKTERSESLFGEVIFSYTRAQAIADRVLVDVTPTALEAGFRFPVAATAALMAAVETIPQQYSHEDIEGRLWDLLWMASLAARRAKPGCSRIAFEVIHTSRAQGGSIKHSFSLSDQGTPRIQLSQ